MWSVLVVEQAEVTSKLFNLSTFQLDNDYRRFLNYAEETDFGG